MKFTTDYQAERFLNSHGFEIIRGVIIIKDVVMPTPDELNAINLLCDEYDFCCMSQADFLRKQ
jgi:hypothetical protein